MSPFPKKKLPPKPGLKIDIMAAKKQADDLESPDPVEGKPAPDPEEEAESPAEEGDEQYGEKLISDMTAPLISAGMDAATAKSTLADMFRAAANCLSGEGEGDSSEGAAVGGGLPGDDSAY